jgi:hypothetical protein
VKRLPRITRILGPGFAPLLLATVVHVAAAQTRTFDADALPVLTATRQARIGHTDDPKLGFSRIGRVDVDRDGQVYVYDVQSFNIRVFARDGQYVRAIGGRGSGPGEFSSRSGIQGLGVAGDSIWTFESGNRRVNVFRRDGTVVSATTLGGGNPGIPIHNGAVGIISPAFRRSDGTFVGAVEPISPSGGDFESRVLGGRPNQVASSDTVRAPILLYTAGKAKLDTIGWSPLPPDDVPTSPPVYSRGADGRSHFGIIREVGGVVYTVPGKPWVHYLHEPLPNGTVIVNRLPATSDRPSTFEVVRFDLAGTLKERLRFTYRPRRYDGPVLDSLAMRAATKNGELNREAFRAVRSAIQFPEFQSPVFAVWVASDGALWVRREWDGSARHRWIVIDPDGSVRGSVSLPSNASFRASRGDVVIMEEPDSDGIPWLVRYQIAPRKG